MSLASKQLNALIAANDNSNDAAEQFLLKNEYGFGFTGVDAPDFSAVGGTAEFFGVDPVLDKEIRQYYEEGFNPRNWFKTDDLKPLNQSVPRVEDYRYILDQEEQCDSPLQIAIFSRKNLDLLQDLIRSIVLDKMGLEIGRQDDNQLLLFMRSAYLDAPKNHDKNIEEQVVKINKIVLRNVIPIIWRNIIAYVEYARARVNIGPTIDYAISARTLKDPVIYIP